MTVTHERREELLGLADELDDSPILDGPSMAGNAIRELLTEIDQAYEWADEKSHPLITRQGDILSGVARALNGPPPPLTSWSHHDLAEKAEELVHRAEIDAARIGAALKIHAPLEAVDERRGARRKVCAGCGTDSGNWQIWPCPTVRALAGGGEDR